MPAEIVNGEYCASYFAVYTVVGSKGDPYTVTSNGGESPWHCTCKAYAYSGEARTCKHIMQVMREACLWNCQWHDGNTPVALRPQYVQEGNLIHNSECRNCGGPLVAVKVAV